MLVTFSGLDGAGKTTLISLVLEWLSERGVPSTHLTMYDDIGLYASLRRLRDFLKGNPQPERLRSVTAPSPEGPAPLPLRILRLSRLKMAVYFLDLLILGLVRFYVEKIQGRLLIIDRYFYDSLADLSEGMPDGILAAYASLVPVPDCAIFVETSPEAAFARKGEYTVGELTARRRRYQDIFARVPGVFFLVNDDLLRTSERLKVELIARLRLRDV